MFGTIQRDPMLDLLHHLEHRIGRTFNEPFRAAEWPVPEAVTTAWLPLVDIFEEPDAIRLVAELPGVRPSEVKISVEDNLLTIKGTKEQVPQEKAEKVHRYERTYGAFERTFRLSASIDANKIKATCDLGVLTITLPKEKPAQGGVISVGPGRLEKGQRVPMELKVGDRVVYGKYTGSQVELDEEEIILIKESDVIAKLS